ncbi:expressed unknown protein [Seminavis robusta]|uniref:Methyltransferase FkbM domain-containing protein n=1 Tax=Seminavis robusta TaxID=568900 RepID=A0A9N8D6V6_9STRA|nr:expressed unknown protein [Seminavis robusta]|eukprot:Sro16_g011520.1 n/a (393) ;mRNA; r:21698-22876
MRLRRKNRADSTKGASSARGCCNSWKDSLLLVAAGLLWVASLPRSQLSAYRRTTVKESTVSPQSSTETQQPTNDSMNTKTVSSGVVSNPVLSKALSRVQGTVTKDNGENMTWSITDWKTGSELDPNHPPEFTCRWLNFTAKDSGKTIDICAHENEWLSGTIAQYGRWDDCNPLPGLWKDSLTSDNNHANDAIYVDIGTNIGSCVLEMLLSTQASIIAFEPNPKNQFALKSTMSKLPKELQDRVVLVPVGLGAESRVDSLYFASRNMGNGVVSKVIKDYVAQKESDFHKVDIVIERLDSILTEDATIPLSKMDAQGYECHVMDGFSSGIANKISQIKFEVANKWLREQRCLDLFTRIRNFGYDIYAGTRLLTDESNEIKGIEDTIAKRKAATS